MVKHFLGTNIFLFVFEFYPDLNYREIICIF